MIKFNQAYDKLITSSETAQILGISVSSVRNWVKHGFINSSSNTGESGFSIKDVMDLKGRIESGELERLNSRANKIKSSRTFLPDELFGNTKSREHVEKIARHILENELDTSLSLYVLSLNLLKKAGLLMRHNPESFLEDNVHNFRGFKGVMKSIQVWRESLETRYADEKTLELLEFHVPCEDNILGVIYQSVLQEGEKSKLGSYYTPDSVVKGIISRMCCDKRSVSFLDPCCGTGQFLLSFAQQSGKPEQVYGIDIDRIAVNIARINLLLKFPEKDFYPSIYCNDSLQNYNDSQLFCNIDSLPKFDVIATNPPWGYHYTTQERKNLSYFFPEITSGESFSYFLVKSLSMLKHGGKLSFVLPESILNVDIHLDVRKFILNSSAIKRIELGKKIFKKVFSSTVIMDVEKTENSGEIEIVNSDRSYEVDQQRFSDNVRNIFDIQVSRDDESLLKKVYDRKHIKLTDDNSTWGLGIVTGNNKAYISDEALTDYHEPIVKGKDIVPFGLKEVGNFIEFKPAKFQQCIAEEIFRSPEKLIYKYISSRLVFTSDREGLVTLNSANIVIPGVEGIPIYFYEGIFNSRLYNFLFARRFSSVKVLKGHLKELPIPMDDGKFYHSIVDIVTRIKERENGAVNDLVEDLNRVVYKFFKLTGKEIEYIDSISRD